MAAPKFDPATAERLAEIADAERVGEFGEWFIECDDDDALLKQVAGLCGTRYPRLIRSLSRRPRSRLSAHLTRVDNLTDLAGSLFSAR